MTNPHKLAGIALCSLGAVIISGGIFLLVSSVVLERDITVSSTQGINSVTVYTMEEYDKAVGADCEDWDRASKRTDSLAKIAPLNFCGSAKDCKRIRLGCPFGCNTLVNGLLVGEARRIVAEYQAWDCQICENKCLVTTDPIACVSGRCEFQRSHDAEDGAR